MRKSNKIGHKLFFRNLKAPLERHYLVPMLLLWAPHLLQQQRAPIPSQVSLPSWAPSSVPTPLGLWSKLCGMAPGCHTGLLLSLPLHPASAAPGTKEPAPGMCFPTSLPSLLLTSVHGHLQVRFPHPLHLKWQHSLPASWHPIHSACFISHDLPPSPHQEYQQRFWAVLFTAMSLLPRRMSDMQLILSEYLWMELGD